MSPFLAGLTTFSGNIAGGGGQGSGAGGDTTATSGGFTRHTFTTVGDSTFTVTGTISDLEILIVGGGGGGGADNAGGGGAGGVLYYGSETGTSSGTNKTANGSALELSAGTYTVTVGAAGAGHTGNSDGNVGSGALATNGGNSRFRNTSGGTTIDYTAYGGGRGVSSDAAAGSAGSGNGTVGSGGGNSGNNENPSGGSNASTSVGTTGQGFGGGQGSGSGGGGGGGGAGGAGANGSGQYGGRGGYGVTYSISGASTAYAAGGGGGNENDVWFSSSNNAGRTDGIGGTTNASSTNRGNLNALGYGSGGGGQTHQTTYSNPQGGNGSQGIVIIKYPA